MQIEINASKSILAESSSDQLDESNFKTTQISHLSYFWQPSYLAESAWTQHVPFAYWLVENLKPKTIVELGTHYGVSYFAFCQAVDRLGIDTKCFAVDTWKGDEQAGYYDENVFKQVCRFNDAHYSTFSDLIRSKFDEAVDYFLDNSIDLLHIDGLHTLEAVRHDFETWQPKLSERSVVLFHDTNVRERNFGVFKLFDKLKNDYPHFEFIHGHGLGVLGVGKQQSYSLLNLYKFSSNSLDNRTIGEYFGRLGRACLDAYKAKENETRVIELVEQLNVLKKDHEELKGNFVTVQDQNKQLSLQVDQQAQERGVLIERFSELKKSYESTEEKKSRLEEQQATWLTERRSLEQLNSEQKQKFDEEKSLLQEKVSGKNKKIEERFKELAMLTKLLEDSSEKVTLLEKQLDMKTKSCPEEALEKKSGLRSALRRAKFKYKVLPAQKKLVKKSGLFDRDWYLEQYPDVAEDGLDPLEHYLLYGGFEGRNPCKKFDSCNYLKRYPDVAAARTNPLIHYITFGKDEERTINFLGHIKDNIKSQVETIKMSGLFNESWYLQEYPDVKILEMDSVEHYVWIGARLGRLPYADFNTKVNTSALAKSNQEDINPLINLIRTSGGNLSNKQINPDIKDVKQNAIKAEDSIYELISSSILFDPDWYKRKYFDDLCEEDPVKHYIEKGANLGFDPSEHFSTSLYLDNYRDVKSVGCNPLYHYLTHGQREGRIKKPQERLRMLGLTRITPDEKGVPDTILEFDASPIKVQNINKEKIVLHLHLYHVSISDDIISYLSNIRHQFKLLISIQLEEDLFYWRDYYSKALTYAEDVIVKALPNKGRDVAPWLVDFRQEILESTIFCHIHSKKSSHSKSHSGWFRYLSHTTMGNVGIVDQILDILCGNSNVGVVAPCYHWSLASQPSYGLNRKECEKIYNRLAQKPLPEECANYPAGSFFWARTEALKRLFGLNLTRDDFPEEVGEVDGTIAHAIERIIGLLPALAGLSYHMVTVDVAYNLTRYINSSRKNLEQTLKQKSPKKFNIEANPKSCKVAVYSCISGNYEEPTPLISKLDGIDCFLFSDNEKMTPPDGYKFKLSNYISHIPVRTARFVKTHPHIWFSDYDYAVWIDSNLHFLGEIFKYIEKIEAGHYDCGFIEHPVRDNFFEEYEELVKEGIIEKEKAKKQIEPYINCNELFVEKLIETNFFICKPKSERVKKFMSYWWQEINTHTHRDQLSINFALNKSKLKWTNLLPPGMSARDHNDFVMFSHDYKNRKEIINHIINGV